MSAKNIYSFPLIVEEMLSNGLRLMLAEDHEREGVTIALQMPFGEFSDPASREGTTETAIGVMLKGPASLSPEEFSEKMEYSGASLFTDVGDEHCIFGCKMLARSSDQIIPLFWDMLCNPGFRPRELSRIKREIITGLRAELADAASIANKHFGNVLCGKNHPVGRVQTLRSVGKIGLRHIKFWYHSYISPANAFLVIAGDFQVQEILAKWRRLFESWSSNHCAAQAAAGALPLLSGNNIRLIDKKDLSQVSLILGHPVCGELDPFRNELAIANYVLGGGNFSSRLMAHIRSKEGKTYGISSQLSCARNYGIFSIATSTQNDQAASMLAAITEVYQNFSKNGITQEELDKAKQFVTGNMAFQLEGIVNIVEKLLWLKQFGRDISYVERFNERIESITVDTVNRAIRQHLSSPGFAIVAVGKKEEISETLAKYGKVETVNFRSAL